MSITAWNGTVTFSTAQKKTATQLMKRTNCTLKTSAFYLQYFAAIAECQNCQTCKMSVPIANNTGLYTTFFHIHAYVG